MSRLAKLVIALQADAGQGVCFSLSARKAAEYLGEQGHAGAWGALQALCTPELLECVDRGKSGKGGRAAQYVLGKLGRQAFVAEQRP